MSDEALTAESLSGPLRSVAERLGMPFVFRLVEHFGGTTVAIPSGSAGKKQYRRLCAALGDESASALCREFARRAIYIPNLKKAMLDKRNTSLNMERHELARRGPSERALVALLARVKIKTCAEHFPYFTFVAVQLAQRGGWKVEVFGKESSERKRRI